MTNTHLPTHVRAESDIGRSPGAGWRLAVGVPRQLHGRPAVLVVVVAVTCLTSPQLPMAARLSPLPAIDIADTLDLYLQNTLVGRMEHEVRGGGTAMGVTERSHLVARNWTDGSSGDSIELTEERFFGRDGGILRSRQTVRSSAGSSSWLLERTASGWVLRTSAGGQDAATPIPHVYDHVRNTAALYAGLLDSTLRAGATWMDTALEMTSGVQTTTMTRLVAPPGAANGWCWEFEISDSLTRTNAKWLVDRQGRTVMQETPPFVARRAGGAPPAGSSTAAPGTTIADLLSIKSPRPRSGDSVYLSINPTELLDTSVRDFYVPAGGRWLLRQPVRTCAKDALQGAAGGAADRRWLRPTATVQSDDPRIRQLATRVAGQASDPCRVVALLNQHVFTSLRKRNTATFSNAVETLNAGYGDCGEHAVLLAALLRSRGIPATVFLGLVHVDRTSSFSYHAWVGVRSGGHWIFADPAFGAFPATNTLIPLVMDDGGQRMVFLARYIGKLGIQVGGNGAQAQR